jgi:ribosomal protein L11 methyltransferase
LDLSPILPAKEIAVAWLNDCGFSMYEESPDGVVAFALESEWNQEGTIEVIQALGEFAEVKSSKEWVQSENWNAKWESEYEPIDVEGKLCMRAPFHDPPKTGLDIIIQPEMSFGTGHHPTTWQMMRALLNIPLEGRSVLDVGCGTGVLAIAAKKLGAGHVVAFDIDEWSYKNTLTNLERNGLTTDIESFQGTIVHDQLNQQKFDVILANINRNILIAEMDEYASKCSESGHLLLSGFYLQDCQEITSKAESSGFTLKNQASREDWACLMFVNKA